jgi:hypothetical protein
MSKRGPKLVTNIVITIGAGLEAHFRGKAESRSQVRKRGLPPVETVTRLRRCSEGGTHQSVNRTIFSSINVVYC